MNKIILIILVCTFSISCSISTSDKNRELHSKVQSSEEISEDKQNLEYLFISIAGDKSLMVEGLVEKVSNLNALNENGYTPLSLSILYLQFQNHHRILDSLINAGADINAPSACGKTPIIWAAGIGNIPAISKLLDKGADINYNQAGTALMEAAAMGHSNTFQFLLDNGADLNARRPSDKRNAKDVAYYSDQHYIIKIIMDYESDLKK